MLARPVDHAFVFVLLLAYPDVVLLTHRLEHREDFFAVGRGSVLAGVELLIPIDQVTSTLKRWNKTVTVDPAALEKL